MRGVWLLHNNSPVHKSTTAWQAVCDCGFVQLDHPAYNPGYSETDSLTAIVEAWLEGQTEEFYFQGINSSAEKCQKCIEVCCHYIEKMNYS